MASQMASRSGIMSIIAISLATRTAAFKVMALCNSKSPPTSRMAYATLLALASPSIPDGEVAASAAGSLGRLPPLPSLGSHVKGHIAPANRRQAHACEAGRLQVREDDGCRRPRGQYRGYRGACVGQYSCEASSLPHTPALSTFPAQTPASSCCVRRQHTGPSSLHAP